MKKKRIYKAKEKLKLFSFHKTQILAFLASRISIDTLCAYIKSLRKIFISKNIKLFGE